MSDVVVFVDMHNGTKLRREFTDVDEYQLRISCNILWKSPAVRRVIIAPKGKRP